MNEFLTKDLLSEVLGCDVYKILTPNEYPKLHNYRDSDIVYQKTKYTYDVINKYELMDKCEYYCLHHGYEVYGCVTGDIAISFEEDTKGTWNDFPDKEIFYKNDKFKAILDTTLWVIEKDK